MAKKRKGKIRTEFRKKHDSRTRESDLTRKYEADEESLADGAKSERVSGKGDLTRKRTVVGAAADADETGLEVQRQSEPDWLPGRVLSVHGRTRPV